MAKTMTARPAARSIKSPAQREAKVKKTVAVSRKSEPIIQVVERRTPVRATPDVAKKHGVLPTPIATFYF
jgi:hypothetical protein